MQFPLDEPLIQSQTAGLETYHNNRFFQEWVNPQGLVDCIAIAVSRDERVVGHVAWGRHETDGPIEDHEITTLRLLAPHFRRAVTISGLMDMQSLASASLARTLDALTVAVYLVDGDLSIVHANTLAHERLKEGQPVARREGKLRFQSTTIQATLADAVMRAASGDVAIGQRGIGVPLLERDGSAAVAHVLPLARSDLRSGLEQRAKAAVFIASSAAAPSMPAAALAHIYDLTPAETRVFELVASGRTLAEIAPHLGIALATVKSHLQRLFEKTGTARQAELVRLAASLSL
jgi:DNA-binding CsgD family transcriptional regulator